MRTNYETPAEYAKKALEITEQTSAVGARRPEHFKEVMRKNRGALSIFGPYGPAKDGMERKNPVIVALGDSVTAGHFEYAGDPEVLFAKVDKGELEEGDVIEITDARECYLERFRSHLIDKYEQTSVSTINSGIAGDTMYGMQKRLYRDVIRYQPDLVLINGSLNWGVECGDTETYRKLLLEVVNTIKNETKADIVLMTPNMDIPPCGLGAANTEDADIPSFGQNIACTLQDRVRVIRELAVQEEVCLADTYAVWEAYEAAGYPVKALLANGMNHPSKTGHEMYARVLMKLMQ
ncbi:MAG: GDSL-type esterase/lipase family protein [Lachnospiraceae bacterium]|nr:GDSL-type esterase/lipase family protein [Lachnospiraceae bacterium]